MCGIAGFIGVGDAYDISAMIGRLRHRGPDDEGLFVNSDKSLYLGHRRLTIRDMKGGGQPMVSADGAICVVYNGEIYNHSELRDELVGRGHRFESSHSDTEVLVHGYREWGDGLAGRLNGMFAFAIFDRKRNKLYLARDRFGEKPLYYYSRNGFFAFASELHALVSHRSIARQVSLPALRKLLSYGYIPAPYALYEGASKLPAGQMVTIDLADPRPEPRGYWRFALQPDEDMGARGEAALAEELRHLVIQAVNRRFVSDVPLGLFLSGGLDSSAILAAASQGHPASSVQTFTIGFRERSFDESEHARAMAEHIGSQHREQMLDLTSARTLMPSVLARLDEPLGDASIVPTFMLSEFTRQYVKVALSGDGGDELFAGYDPFAALAPAAAYSRIVPQPLHRLVRSLVERMPQSPRNMSLDFKLRRTMIGLSQPESAWAPSWMAPLDPDDADDLFEHPVRLEDLYSEAMELWESNPESSRVERLLEFYTHFYLQNDILAKVDRASMMSSLETRAIFLDNDVVDFCMRLPTRFKYRHGVRKYLLKKAFETDIPDRIRQRSKKGFGIPLRDWLKDTPDEPPLDPVPGVKMSWVRNAWDSHRSGRADHRLFMWTWWSLQSVLKTATAPRQ